MLTSKSNYDKGMKCVLLSYILNCHACYRDYDLTSVHK